MARKTQSGKLGPRHFVLIGYVGLCLLMAVLALGLALGSDDTASAQSGPVQIEATATQSPLMLTIAAEDRAYQDSLDATGTPPAQHGMGGGAGARSGAGANGEHDEH